MAGGEREAAPGTASSLPTCMCRRSCQPADDSVFTFPNRWPETGVVEGGGVRGDEVKQKELDREKSVCGWGAGASFITNSATKTSWGVKLRQVGFNWAQADGRNGLGEVKGECEV